MDQFTKIFYNDLINGKYDYQKIKLTAESYNKLPDFRLNNLAERFGGCIYGEDQSWEDGSKGWALDFTVNKVNKNYQLYVTLDNDNSYLNICATEEDKKVRNKDKGDIKAWLKNHGVYDGFVDEGNNGGFYGNGDLWHAFKFPEDEKTMYDFLAQLIELLNGDKKSIYRGE